MIRFTANCPCCDKHFRSSVEWKVDLAYNAHADECCRREVRGDVRMRLTPADLRSIANDLDAINNLSHVAGGS